MRKLLLLLLLLPTQVFGQSWFSLSWPHRYPITITNGESRGLVYYHAAISFTGASYTSLNGCARGDRADLRVTDSDGVTLLNFWLEDTTISSSVMLLVKVPFMAASTTKTIYVYCGNASGTSVSSASSTIVTANAPPLDQTPSVTVDGTASVFNGPAILGVSRDGATLSVVYGSQAQSNYGASGGLFSSKSTDNGATWAARTTLISAVSGTDVAIRSTYFTTLSTGRLMGWIQKGPDANMLVGTAASYPVYSDDGGTTYNIGFPLSTPAAFAAADPYGHITELSNGDLIDPWEVTRAGGDTQNSVVLMTCAHGKNCTDGTNWGLYGGTIAAATVMRDGTQTLSYAEADVVKTATKYVSVARVDPAAAFVVSTSTDLSSWSAPSTLTDVTGASGGEQISSVLSLLADGNILLTFGERTAQVNNNFGMGSAISTDSGATWTQLAMPYLISGTHDAGYASTVQLSNGKLYSAVPYTNGAGGSGSQATLYGFTWDEDWAANPYGDYHSIADLTAFTVGANAVRSTTVGHSGTDSIKGDNNAGTGATILYLIGNQSSGYPKKAVALNFWARVDAVSAATFPVLKDGTTVGTTGNRLHTAIQDFAADGFPIDEKWFDGAAYNNWTVAQTGTIASATWAKYQLRGKTASNSSFTGGLSFNNVLAGNNATNAFNGTNNRIDRGYWQVGSVGSTNNDVAYVDDVYTDQWLANVPTFSVGAQQNGPVASNSRKLLLGVGQ